MNGPIRLTAAQRRDVIHVMHYHDQHHAGLVIDRVLEAVNHVLSRPKSEASHDN